MNDEKNKYVNELIASKSLKVEPDKKLAENFDELMHKLFGNKDQYKKLINCYEDLSFLIQCMSEEEKFQQYISIAK